MAKSKAKKRKQALPAERLGPEDWIRAGLTTLARHGMTNVRVERIARDLGVTKGSFYWHFRDRQALLDDMLSSWRKQSSRINEAVMERHQHDGRAQLRALLRAPQTTSDASEGSQIELALRLWARRDEHVSAVLQDMNRHRHQAMRRILANCGIKERHLPGLTLVLASVMLSLWTTDGRPAAERDCLVRQMIDLVELFSGD